MATAVGDLVVRLGAMTGQFDKKMRNSQTRITRFGGAVSGLSKRLIGLGAGFLGVAGIGGMTVMIRRNLQALDSLGKLSDRLGIATEKLQGLRYAAELTGAGADTLDAGLTTMAKRLGEAARGAGAAKPALEHIGLAIKDIIALSPDQQFIAIAEAISKLETHTERAGIAANIFSKGNMTLVNTLAEGSEGLREMQLELEKLGGTLSREMITKAEAANDAMTKLGVVFKGISMKTTIELSPAIEHVAKLFSEVLPGALHLSSQAFLWWQKSITRTIGGVVSIFDQLAQRPALATILFGPGFAANLTRNADLLSAFVDNLETQMERIDAVMAGKAPPGAPQGPPAQPPGWPSQDLETMFGPEAAKGGGGAGKDFWTRYFDDLERRGTEVNRLWQMVETPMERYQRQMQALGPLGKIPEELRSRVQAQYWQQYLDAMERMQPPPEPAPEAVATAAQGPRHAAAAERGSAEAWNRLLTAMGGGKKDPLVQINKAILAENKKQTAAQERMEDRGGEMTEIPPA